MKKHVFFWKSLAGVLPFLFLGMGCSSESEDPEPFLRISGENQTVNLLAEGSSQTIAVETNTSDWTISVNGNWCTATKEGESIVISAGKNDSEDSRSATVTASVGNIKVTITVTQAGTKSTDPYLRISDTDKSIALSADGSSKTIAVDASTSDWTVSASDTWCAVKKEGTNIVITAGKNDGTSSRSATVTASLGSINVSITVTQAAPSGQIPTVAWTKVDIGPKAGGSYTPNGSEITITGKGKFESNDQSFTFVYQEVTGDFVMTAKINSYADGKGDGSSQAGLMIVPDITATANDFIHLLAGTRDNLTTFSYSQRVTAEVAAGRGTLSGATGSGDAYLKLERVGSTYKASYSLDGGNNYGNVRTVAFTATLPDKLYVGLAVSSGDNSKLATAVFSNVKINGELQSFENP
jgi:hypothetical protein